MKKNEFLSTDNVCFPCLQYYMELLTIQAIVKNYQLLADPNNQTREKANSYLYSLVDRPEVWIIAKEMISNQSVSDYQLLGAQILYQKVERDIEQLTQPQINELKEFVFGQLVNQQLNFATIRKLASSAALIAIWLILDTWPTFLPDIVRFMQGSVMQLKSGLAVLERLPEELKQNYHIKHSVRMLIRQNLIQKSDLICRVYCSAIMLNQPIITDVALSGLQSWIYVGFPIMKYTEMVQLLIKLFNVDDLYLENCCKILREGLKHAAREKFQSIGESYFMIQHQKYKQAELQSLQLIVSYIRETKLAIFSSIQSGNNSEQIEIYTSIIKQMLLSYGFLLKEDFGYELIEMLFQVLEKGDLKLSYSTFQFWIEFCDKIDKMKVDQVLQLKFWQIVEHLLQVILQRTLLDNDTLHYELLKEDDTLDDISKISLNQYRKQAQNIIKFTFDYFSAKKGKEGSTLFFQKLLVIVEQFKGKGQLARGLQLAVYAVKSAQESMVKDYDTQNMVVFITFVMGELESKPDMPTRLIAQVLNLLKDCSHEVKQTESLFLRCLDFCLKYVSEDSISHYAVYAFQSLMESINELANDSLVNSLMNFYSQTVFSKETILEKILEGILTTITKLTNRQVVEHYLKRIINSFQTKNKAMLTNESQPQESYYISLIEIKTLLDAFDHFKEADRQYFRPTFLRISSYGILIVSKIIHTYISKRLKFSTVGQLGASLGLLRNALKICQNINVATLPLEQYTTLLNIIISILTPNSIELFNEYSDLLDVICKVYSQFVGEKIGMLNDWLVSNLPIINTFFMNQIQRATMVSIDPDILKWYFALQESVILYSREIYLMQEQHGQIYDLALSSVRFINERAMQRRAVNFLFQCVQMKDVYSDRVEPTLKAVFASIPIMSNLCYINLGRILVSLLEKTDLKTKQNIVRQLLEYQPYTTVNKDLKEVITKLLAFAIDTKIERYIKGAINDLAEAKNKDASNDLALHLELRFASWKKEFKRMVKDGTTMSQ